MPMRTRPKGLRERLGQQGRVRGLQGVMSKGSEERGRRQETLNRLNQLRWEKERLQQEQHNWESKLQLINKRLAEIQDAEVLLERDLFAEPHGRAQQPTQATSQATSQPTSDSEEGGLVLRY